MDRLIKILKKINIDYAYHHFPEGSNIPPPFMVYNFPEDRNFSADGYAYHKGLYLHLEVYTECKDIKLEKQIEEILDKERIFYRKTELWIESEKLYEILYEFTL